MPNERTSFQWPKPILWVVQHFHAIKISFRQLSIVPISTLMTFAVIGIVLALPMGLFVFLKNIQTISYGLHDSAQISLYLNTTTPAQVNDLLSTLKTDKDIQNTQYISPEAGLEEFRKNSGFGDALSLLKSNPLPGVIVIKPASTIKNSLQAEHLLDRLKSLPNVNQAQLDMSWLMRLNAMLQVGHRLTIAIMLVFFLAVLLIISHTIRLMTQNYESEIRVTKLLGATDDFIRRPFLYSGIIYGLVGGIIAWLLVDTIAWFLQSPITALANLYGTSYSIQGLNLTSTFMLLGAGMLLGYFGSWLATNRHIREINEKSVS